MTTITETVDATVAATIGHGRYLIRLIDAGQGSSGVYESSVLREAAASRVWPAGTHMYIDHPSATEDRDRPERTLRDLAGVLAEDARWDPASDALVAEAKIFGAYRPMLDELAGDIGVSIRALAEQDRAGNVTRIVEGLSVDFVTRAGRGGKVLQILESARQQRDSEITQIVEAGFQISPVGPVDTNPQEAVLPTIDEAEYKRLTETATAFPQLEAELAEARKMIDQINSDKATAEEAAKAARAEAAEARIAASTLPEVAKNRVREAIKDDPSADVEAAIKAEADYLAAVAPTKPGLFGASETLPPSGPARTHDAWGHPYTKGA